MSGSEGAAANDVAVATADLAVTYTTFLERKPTLKRTLARWQRGERVRRTVDALRGVDLTVPRGGVVAVVGANGAGKSTLLRAIAGIVPPTRGEVRVRGRVTALLRTGLGFNPVLTGRENIVLGGLAVGMSEAEVRARMDSIVEFAGLGDLIDAPLRVYSSGMSSRLGFAVAAHLDPDVLLLDEALSAGDEAFRERCETHIRRLVDSDATVVIVTHALQQAVELADRVVWLRDGLVARDGEPGDVVAAYRRFAHGDSDA